MYVDTFAQTVTRRLGCAAASEDRNPQFGNGEGRFSRRPFSKPCSILPLPTPPVTLSLCEAARGPVRDTAQQSLCVTVCTNASKSPPPPGKPPFSRQIPPALVWRDSPQPAWHGCGLTFGGWYSIVRKCTATPTTCTLSTPHPPPARPPREHRAHQTSPPRAPPARHRHPWRLVYAKPEARGSGGTKTPPALVSVCKYLQLVMFFPNRMTMRTLKC